MASRSQDASGHGFDAVAMITQVTRRFAVTEYEQPVPAPP